MSTAHSPIVPSTIDLEEVLSKILPKLIEKVSVKMVSKKEFETLEETVTSQSNILKQQNSQIEKLTETLNNFMIAYEADKSAPRPVSTAPVLSTGKLIETLLD